jgi:hypothetical protein
MSLLEFKHKLKADFPTISDFNCHHFPKNMQLNLNKLIKDQHKYVK